ARGGCRPRCPSVLSRRRPRVWIRDVAVGRQACAPLRFFGVLGRVPETEFALVHRWGTAALAGLGKPCTGPRDYHCLPLLATPVGNFSHRYLAIVSPRSRFQWCANGSPVECHTHRLAGGVSWRRPCPSSTAPCS